MPMGKIEEWPMNNPGHLIWIALGALAGFGSSFIFGDLLSLPVDLYYLVYFVIVIMFLSVYIKKTHFNPIEWILRRWVWGVTLGLISGALMVQFVLEGSATDGFTGAYLGWMIFWRGWVYGAIDGLLLSSFPWVVPWRAFDVERKPLRKKIAFSLLAWFFILAVTTAY